MTVELLSYKASTLEECAAKEAALAGIQSIEILLRMLSHQSPLPNKDIDCSTVADVTINKFRKFISVLDGNRTGHARFRRGPVNPIHQSHETTGSGSDLQAIKPASIGLVEKLGAVSEGTTSFVSFLTGDSESLQPLKSVSLGFQNTNNKPRFSSGKPPLSAAMKRKCMSMEDVAVAKCGSSSGQCHCLKNRKSTVKRVVRVPAISSKMADIPADDFSWRKYGQKPIKGSPHPRGYYRCSTMKGCPALKHVERTSDDSSMLIVTYKDEHIHS